MRRRDLSHQELEAVIERKQSGTSWLKIEKETGIPRRAAKRAYENWQRSRSFEELKEVRKNVAAEEFREHMDSLIQLAEFLATHLPVPSSPYEGRDAEAVLNDLLQRHIREELEPYRVDWDSDAMRMKQRQVLRQNQMLLKSLRDHTGERVRWESLEEWKQAWNTCVKALAELRGEVDEVVRNFVSQKPDLKERIESGSGKKDALELMVDGVLLAAWAVGVDGRPEGYASFTTASQGQGIIVTYGDTRYALGLTFTETALAQGVAKVCTLAAQILYRGDTPGRATGMIHTMEERIGELNEMLHRLKLVPVILRTRCEICPA